MAKAGVTKIERITRVGESSVPKGVHDGAWGGYIVRFSVGVTEYRYDVDAGVRGIDVPCRIHADGETVWIESV